MNVKRITVLFMVLMMGVSSLFVGSVAAAGDVTVTVVDEDGEAVDGATVDILDPDDGTVVQTGETDADGDLVLEDVADGEYDVEVNHDDYQHFEDELTVDGEDLSVEYTVSEYRTVDVDVEEVFENEDEKEVTEALEGAEIALHEVDENEDGDEVPGTVLYSDFSDVDGEVTLEGVEDGDYFLTADHDEHPELELEEQVTVDDDRNFLVQFDSLDEEVTLTDLDAGGGLFSGGSLIGVGLGVLVLLYLFGAGGSKSRGRYN